MGLIATKKGVQTMYKETLAKTVAQATNNLFILNPDDFVFHCDMDCITDAQKDTLCEYLTWLDYCYDRADRQLVLDNLFVNLTNDSLYVIAISDDGDDNIEYYFEELEV